MTGPAEVPVTITWLEMDARPAPGPELPSGVPVALIAAEDPPPAYFLYLYGAVGAEYDWTDWFTRDRARLAAFLADPKVRLTTLMVRGWPGGFFVLDSREPGVTDLAYFGLVGEAIGLGLGRWLLATAVQAGWAVPGTRRMTVNTCTLDHPRALGLYQRAGFVPVRRETVTRAPDPAAHPLRALLGPPAGAGAPAPGPAAGGAP